MTTECPSCHKQVEHEDFLFEVKCPTCNCRFNPFMQVGDVPGLDSVNIGGNEMSLGDEPSATGQKTDFAESNALFQEIRDFGENVGGGQPVSQPKPPPVPAAAAAKTSIAKPVPKKMPPVETDAIIPFQNDGESLITAGDILHGYSVESYLTPVSVWADFDAAIENPLKPALDSLLALAKNSGANAILSLRWALSHDSTKVLVSGTAVYCGKN